ncbi:MAG: PEP-utilizing enzyme [Betaproteobacteria bacterium]
MRIAVVISWSVTSTAIPSGPRVEKRAEPGGSQSPLARRYGIQAVVGCGDATARLRTWMRLTVDGSPGTSSDWSEGRRHQRRQRSPPIDRLGAGA